MQASNANVERDDGSSSVEAAAELDTVITRSFEEMKHSAMMTEQIVDRSGVAMANRGDKLASFTALPKIVKLGSQNTTCILNPLYGKVISMMVMVMLAATAHCSCYIVATAFEMAYL